MNKRVSQVDAWIKTPEETLNKLISSETSFSINKKEVYKVLDSVGKVRTAVLDLDSITDLQIERSLKQELLDDSEYSRNLRDNLISTLNKIRSNIAQIIMGEGVKIFQLNQNKYNFFDPCLRTYPKWSKLVGRDKEFAKINYFHSISPSYIGVSPHQLLSEESLYVAANKSKSISIINQNENQILLKHRLSHLSLDEKRRVLRDISASLAHLHENNLIHKSLSVDNVLLEEPHGQNNPISKAILIDHSSITAPKKVITLPSKMYFSCPENILSEDYIYGNLAELNMAQNYINRTYQADFENNIFLFGIFALQVISGNQNLSNQIRAKFSNWSYVPNLREKTLLTLVNETITASHPINKIIKDCLALNRSSRPSAEDLAEQFAGLSTLQSVNRIKL